MQSMNEIRLSRAELDLFEDDLVCPITQERFIQPVLTSAGATYEFGAISKWLEGNDTDPNTRLQVTKQLIPNRFVEAVVLTEFNSELFYCPLTKELIREPVTTADGYTYEKAALEKYFLDKGDVEPTTGKPIELIGEAKFVNNICAKNLIAHYTNFKEKIDLLFVYFEQGNLDAILKSEAPILNAFLLRQTRENRLKCFGFEIDNLNVKAVKFFIKFFRSTLDEDVAFFNSVDQIKAIAAKYFPKAFNPLDNVFSWQNLPQQIQTIKDNLVIQKQFREALMKDHANMSQYEPEQILFSIDSVNEDGETLLHWAVKNNNLPLVECLLEKGIDFTKENNQGKTAVSMLDAISPHQAIVSLFFERGLILDLTDVQKEQLTKREKVSRLPPALSFLGEVDFLKPLLNLIFEEVVVVPPLQKAELIEKQHIIMSKKSEVLKGIQLRHCRTYPFFSSDPAKTDSSPSEDKAGKTNRNRMNSPGS